MRILYRTGLLAAACLMGWPAVASTPRAHATLASDGSYTLVIQSGRAWTEAEVTVADDGAQDLGPAGEDERVEVAGVVASPGPLHVTVHAATPDEAGFTWTFEVVPDAVPVALPVVEPDLGLDVRRRIWPVGRP
ncbi:MAG: hypothetical protein VX265_10170 [Myxococcota bacterium]|nr:hypothetical protein [Myxococcota bacterium]MEC8425235.1 hypothetical protein [Myxococcota bacterium]